MSANKKAQSTGPQAADFQQNGGADGRLDREPDLSPGEGSSTRGIDPLQKLLAEREALCRELESSWGTAIERVLPKTPAGVPAGRDSAVLSGALAEARERLRALEEQAAGGKEERDVLRSRLEQESKKAEQLRETCDRQEQRIAELEKTLHEARTAIAQLSSAPQATAPDPTELAERLRELQARCAELAQAREKERRSHSLETANLTRQLSQVRQQYEARIAELTTECERFADGGGAGKPTRGAAQEATAASIATPPLQAGAAPRKAHGDGQVLLLDDSEIGEDTAARLLKFRTSALASFDASSLGEAFSDGIVGCLAVNLALASSWRLLRAVRSVDPRHAVPIVAYALAERAESGFWFGTIDFALLPLEKDGILNILRGVAPAIKQVIAIGPDEGALATARKSLANGRVSVDLAPDRRSALTLVRGNYPQAALVYATPNPVDGFRTVAGIRSMAIFREIPSVFVLDEVAQPREEDRLSAGARTTLRLGNLTVADLVNLLVEKITAVNSPAQSQGGRAAQTRV